jgi:cell division protein FtsX
MKLFRRHRVPLWIFVARDVLRRPGVSLVNVGMLAVMSFSFGVVLMGTHAVQNTAVSVLESGPSLVIRKLGPFGQVPVDESQAREALSDVKGIVRVQSRIWGIVPGREQPVVVWGVDRAMADLLQETEGFAPPKKGEAVMGPGLEQNGKFIEFYDSFRKEWTSFDVVGRLDEKQSATTHGTVYLHAEPARQLLGLDSGHASDLALDVFHPAEERAIVPAIVDALPWPALVSTKQEEKQRISGRLFRRGGLALTASVPLLLALVVFVFATWKGQLARAREIGIAKTLGWTGADVVGFHVRRAGLLGMVGIALGLALATWMVLGPSGSVVGSLLVGWNGRPPELFLDGTGTGLVWLQVAALVFVPWMAAVFWPTFRLASVDPGSVLAEKS